jgi:hypothetical protein
MKCGRDAFLKKLKLSSLGFRNKEWDSELPIFLFLIPLIH